MKVSTQLVILLGISLWSGGHSFSASLLPRAENSVPEPEEHSVNLAAPQIELIARRLKGTIDIPFLNNALEQNIIQAALTSFCEVAPVALPEDLFRDLVNGKKNFNLVKEDVIQIINDEICIPIIPRKVQDQIVGTICTVMFTPEAAQKKMVGRAVRDTLSEFSEEEFATMLNEMIDVPLMNEDQEQKIALKLAGSITDAFETLVPESMRDILTNTSPEELQEARQNLIDRLNEKVDIPFKSEAEERKYFVIIVDFLLKRYGLDKGTKLPQEEFKDVSRELDLLTVELELFEASTSEKLELMKTKHSTLTTRKAELGEMLEKDDGTLSP